MQPEDFDPDLAVDAFNKCLDQIAKFFEEANPKQSFEEPILRQVFENRPIQRPLFRLFCMNSQNRAQGVSPRGKENDWDALTGFFLHWDPVLFNTTFPPAAHFPTPKLTKAFKEFAIKNGIILGNINRHLTALVD